MFRGWTMKDSLREDRRRFLEEVEDPDADILVEKQVREGKKKRVHSSSPTMT